MGSLYFLTISCISSLLITISFTSLVKEIKIQCFKAFSHVHLKTLLKQHLLLEFLLSHFYIRGFTAYLSTEQLTNSLYVPMFGNRELLHWEANRKEQEEWLRKAGLRLPATFKNPDEIDLLVIAKLPGAKGGRGYFLANSPSSFRKKFKEMVDRGLLREEDVDKIHL
ncbi:MAG TPA: DUF1246 domain-containing protein [Acidobacteriota bacterium]|nr:DUF1246 domain-containing protein [Acidobacteriota bacterium]